MLNEMKSRMFSGKTLVLIFVLFFISTLLSATIINVPADQPTIQAGIDAAAETDTVLVADGTYFENIDFIGKAITVASNYLIDADTLHIENTIINGSQPDDPDYGSCVRFLSGEDTTSVITGFTLTEGTGYNFQDIYYSGGGIYCEGSSPKIASNIITNNSTEYSGGVGCSFNSSAIILNNVISYNTATENIGGLYIHGSSNAHVEGNIISNNTAFIAGGVAIHTGSLTFVNNIICNNTAGTFAGGIVVHDAAVDIIDCTINDNHAGTFGGGVRIYGNSDVILSYTSIYGNSATYRGGGIEIDNSSIPIIINCTIYDNEAPGCGSQIDCWSGGLEAVNSFIGGNTSNGSVYFNISGSTFNYCDFYNSGGPDFAGSQITPDLGVITTVNYNDDPCDIFMNIFLDPLFVDQANDDFHLTEFSPCIDAGDPDSDPDPDGSIVDIGRYYYPGTEIEDNTIVQTEDYLQQNYPNPFNPTTIISYQLPENSKVELTVYNLKGQKVKQLVSDQLSAGQHSVVWNGKDNNGKSVSSGIYFYILKTDNFEKTKKMILLR